MGPIPPGPFPWSQEPRKAPSHPVVGKTPHAGDRLSPKGEESPLPQLSVTGDPQEIPVWGLRPLEPPCHDFSSPVYTVPLRGSESVRLPREPQQEPASWEEDPKIQQIPGSEPLHLEISPAGFLFIHCGHATCLLGTIQIRW